MKVTAGESQNQAQSGGICEAGRTERALQPGASTTRMSGFPDLPSSSVSTAGYEDGLGRRSVRFNREVGGMLECLHLRPQFVVFEAALRARAEQLARLDDERFAVVRGFESDAGG